MLATIIQRREEYGKLVGALSKEAFGDKIHEMYEIIGLGTHPDFQGLGYGSALTRRVLEKVKAAASCTSVYLLLTVTMQSDAEGCDVWLVTTDAWRFYEYLGFTIARSGVMGTNNPAWDGKPVTIRIVSCLIPTCLQSVRVFVAETLPDASTGEEAELRNALNGLSGPIWDVSSLSWI